MLNTSSVSVNSFTVSNESHVISTQRKMKIVRGQYDCQGECKKLAEAKIIDFAEQFEPVYTLPFDYKTHPAAVHMRQIVIVYGPAKVSQLIETGYLYCSACSHAFHPFVCQGDKRKICPCCTVRLQLLKTVLKKSTVKKIQDTVLIHRME